MKTSLSTLLVLLSSLAAICAEPLPRVLILCDSTHHQSAATAASMLKGRVDVVRPSLQPGDTGTALTRLDELLGDGKWDLIHFNFGIPDLAYKAPGIKSVRAMSKHAGGVRTTTPEQYEKNLEAIIKRFKATGAKLIWANTEPIVSSRLDSILDPGSEKEYNTIAAKVMARHHIPINDIHAYATANVIGKRDASRISRHPPMMKGILRELKLLKPIKGPVRVFIMAGGTTNTGAGIVNDLNRPREGKPGTLDQLVLDSKNSKSLAHLIDKDGNWTQRPDVWMQFNRRGGKSGQLTVGYGGDRKRGMGPEIGMGHVLGDHFSEQVFIFKTDLGNPSLAKDLSPPSAGKSGKLYLQMIKQINTAITTLPDQFPEYTAQAGYKIEGLVLNFGEADKDAKLYAKHLPLLISDLRKELKLPQLPVVVVGTGQGGREKPIYPDIIRAQQAIASTSGFRGNVAYTETRDFWPTQKESPSISPEQWYGNAASYYRIGHAIGKDMLKLLK